MESLNSNPPAVAPLARGKILFADDDESFRTGLGKRLTRVGFACEMAGSATETIALLESEEYDALLSDINMPGNVGLEMIQSLPAVSGGLPVILLTGNPTLETATRSVRLRVKAYLTKPPDFEELCALLDLAVVDCRSLRVLKDSRQRLRDWDHEIEHIQHLLQQSGAADRQPTMQGYLRLTLRNLVVGLIELENLLSRSGEQLDTAQLVEKQSLLEGVRKTIGVLQKTKDHFKSKELGELRKDLERLIG